MNPYVLALENPDSLKQEFNRIGVDWRGSSIMVPKGFTRIVKISRLPSFLANILKQEMLSIGGDVALSRDSITGKDKNTDCLILGNTAQISSFSEKLKKQPFGLSLIGRQIKAAMANFERKASVLDLSGKKVRFGRRTYVMGIVNVTPDSFSGDGIFGADVERSFEFARDMARAGADILDVGGESTRPGSKRISAKEEMFRVLPLLKRMKGRLCVPVSIDTTKSEVAHAALDLGVSIVNDISALRFDKKMAKLIARYKACVVLMHMKGTPGTMQNDPRYENVTEEILLFLSQAVKNALDAGIAEDKIIVDPGIGFGKNVAHNLEILKRLKELKCLGRPILVGLSRKYFIGKILNADAANRAWGTAAAISMAIGQGADLVRVHDVKETKQVVLMADALSRGGNN
ncbi:MAG: dihydropteroate synthase [Candidatus Omnitrophota bacterium]